MELAARPARAADPRFKDQIASGDTIPVSGGKTAREVQEQLTLDAYGGRDNPNTLSRVNPIGNDRIQLLGPD